jgi:hypothetical protein
VIAATGGISTFGFNISDSGRSSRDNSSGPTVLRKSASEGDVTLQNVAATAAAAAIAAAAIGSGRERVASPLSRSVTDKTGSYCQHCSAAAEAAAS